MQAIARILLTLVTLVCYAKEFQVQAGLKLSAQEILTLIKLPLHGFRRSACSTPEPDCVHFYLYPDPTDYKSSDELVTGDLARLHASRYKKELPLIILIHGFKNNHTTDFSKTLIKAYLSSSYPANIVSIYWKGASGNPFQNPILPEDVFYALAVENISPASKLIVQFLNFLIANGGLTSDRIQIVGFSLGAHVAGVTGYTFLQENQVQIGRITGLDPAKPLFRFKKKEGKLDPSDALFVDIVHTNKGMKGTEDVIGHVDFLPNRGGPTQPECANITDFSDVFTGTCSHATSYKFFARSIKDPTLVACLCTKRNVKVKKVKSSECMRDKCAEPVIFGQYCPPTAHGIYYLNITLDPEFGTPPSVMRQVKLPRPQLGHSEIRLPPPPP